MRVLVTCAASIVASGCNLYFADHHLEDDAVDAGYQCGDAPTHAAPYSLVVDRTATAEGPILGVDADGTGMLWIAYPEPSGTQARVTLVHWDPITRTRAAAFTFADELLDPASMPTALAYVGGQIWLSYPDLTSSALRVIDPATGAAVRTLGGLSDIRDLSAFGSGSVLLAESVNNRIVVADATTGGDGAMFSTSFFATTLSGVAWRPGEIWSASWYSPEVQVSDEHGTFLTSIAVAQIPPSETAADRPILAFDRGALLVAYNSQLTWFTINEQIVTCP